MPNLMIYVTHIFYNPFIPVNNLKLRSETLVDRYRAHPLDKQKRWFSIYFFIKTDIDLVYYITSVFKQKSTQRSN
jgi:hypothetical protein